MGVIDHVPHIITRGVQSFDVLIFIYRAFPDITESRDRNGIKSIPRKLQDGTSLLVLD